MQREKPPVKEGVVRGTTQTYFKKPDGESPEPLILYHASKGAAEREGYTSYSGCIDLKGSMGNRLGLERTTTAATFDGVGVIERKATLFDAIIEVDRGAIEVEGAFLVDHDRDAMMLVPGVNLLVELFVEAERVAETAATAASHANA